MRKLVLWLLTVAFLVPVVALAQDITKTPQRIKYVAPVYPEDAKAAKVSGTVIAEAVIGEDGSVTGARILRSIALLDDAALAAARQWKYTPTTLNGKAVPVIMTVSIVFKLDDTTGSTAMRTVASFAASPDDPVLLNGRKVLRIGGDVKAPERIKYVQPVYPQDMREARVMGTVIIEAIVDETGHVAETKVLRSVTGLDQAAVDAVMQWEYTPTLLNGAPVPVLMTVTVTFTIG